MLDISRLRAGKWEGIWSGPAAPAFSVLYQGRDLPDLQIADQGGQKWLISVPIPPDLLSDGVQTFILQASGETVGNFSIVSGAPLEADLRAEISLLRAELDLLKQAFRHHCTQS